MATATMVKTTAPAGAATGRTLANMTLPCGCELQIREITGTSVNLVKVHCGSGATILLDSPMSFDEAAIRMARLQSRKLLELAESES
jgi:hypothetical protein